MKIEFYMKNVYDNINSEKIDIHVLDLPEKIYKDIIQNLSLTAGKIDLETMSRIWAYIEKLNKNTLGKFYEYSGWMNDGDSAQEFMYSAFESYTGLSKDECTQEFIESVREFLNADSGAVDGVMENMRKDGERFEYEIFLSFS